MPKIDPNIKAARKKEILTMLEKTLGVVSTACNALSLNRGTFYHWVAEDPEFAKAVKEIEDYALDFVESKLFTQIKANNVTSIIFYLKTKGKNRGYVERIETMPVPTDEFDGKSVAELEKMLKDLKIDYKDD